MNNTKIVSLNQTKLTTKPSRKRFFFLFSFFYFTLLHFREYFLSSFIHSDAKVRNDTVVAEHAVQSDQQYKEEIEDKEEGQIAEVQQQNQTRDWEQTILQHLHAAVPRTMQEGVIR